MDDCTDHEEYGNKISKEIIENRDKTSATAKALKNVATIRANMDMDEFKKKRLRELREDLYETDEKYRIFHDSTLVNKFRETFAFIYRQSIAERFKFDYTEDSDLKDEGIYFKPKPENVPSYFYADQNHMQIKKIIYNSRKCGDRINKLLEDNFFSERKQELFKKRFMDMIRKTEVANKKNKIRVKNTLDERERLLNKCMNDIIGQVHLELKNKIRKRKGDKDLMKPSDLYD